jgi:hypothetical protein
MDHWFDSFTKSLGSYSPSRRTAIATLAVAASGNLLFRTRPLRAGPLPSPLNRASPQNTSVLAPQAAARALPVTTLQGRPSSTLSTFQLGPCRITRSGASRTMQLSTKTISGGKVVTVDQTSFSGPGVNTHQLIAEVGGVKQFQYDASNSAFRLSFGPAFGLGTQTFASLDGKTLTGRIGGRDIVPITVSSFLPAGKAATALIFADGKPPPEMKEDPAIRKALQDGLYAAGENGKLCVTTRAGPSKSGPGFITSSIPPAGGSYYASQAFTDYNEDLPQCSGCYSDCNAQFSTCMSNNATICASLTGPAIQICMAIADNATCGPNQSTCEDNCRAGPCQPVNCGLDGCAAGHVCADPSTSLCCPGGSTVCSSGSLWTWCCKDGGTCLAPGGNDGTYVYYCCPQGHAVCAEQCCSAGSGCSNENICCPVGPAGEPSVSCRGVCCSAGNVCTPGGNCCNPADICGTECCTGGTCLNGSCCQGTSQYYNLVCNGSCCPGLGHVCCNKQCCEGQCLNGKCCPEVQVCGNTCCAPGQNCVGGKCTSIDCSFGTTPCVSPMSNGPPQTICCHDNLAFYLNFVGATCCNGQCCSSGQVCCQGQHSAQLACHLPNECSVLQ